jgi:hypothetical protein
VSKYVWDKGERLGEDVREKLSVEKTPVESYLHGPGWAG